MKNKFNENLMLLRKRKGLTQKQFGEKIGIGDLQVCKYEKGNSIPDMSMLIKMSGVLKCTLDELVGV